MYEDIIANNILEKLDKRVPGSIAEHPIEYLATTNFCDIPTSKSSADLTPGVLLNPQPVKQVLSLKPDKVRKSAIQVKKEMMQRYHGRGYYFLEEYIDTVVEMGRSRVVDF
jgi:hypothetical protein